MKPFFVKMQDFMQKNGNFLGFDCNISSFLSVERFSRSSDNRYYRVYSVIDLDERNKKEKNVIDFLTQIH